MLKNIDKFWQYQWRKVSPEIVEAWVNAETPITDFKFEDGDEPLFTWKINGVLYRLHPNHPPYWFVVRVWIEVMYPRNHVMYDATDGHWYFWDETDSNLLGPYPTEWDCSKAMHAYAQSLNPTEPDNETQGCG